MSEQDDTAGKQASRRLPKAERRRQLLDTALLLVRTDGADRLTLGQLATRAGVSKPVVYDHFATRSVLLIELYKSIDMEQMDALRDALTTGNRSLGETVEVLAASFISCAAKSQGDWHSLGAALAGSEEKEAALLELTDESVRLFASALQPHSDLSPVDLERYCSGLVGAGDALSQAVVRGKYDEADAAASFASLIRCGMRSASD